MSIEQLKELFGSQEAILELVQLEGGELALRNAGSEDPLVKIQFNDEVRALLGDQIPVVAQHMIQAALFALMEKQGNVFDETAVVDEKPKYLS
ncbi:hypothetical protein M0D70_12870 [Acinetobacter portensis]|uniref:Uncharacterized protein n=2 Tax=Acinetobacter TaxID=469 RepID=A0A6L6GI40_9GAMM|nr:MULTISPECIES: hypothetical protein [Acinetobacter]MCK7610265.1 hypothetical protein [Acinetobacter portensis]MCK7641033.1 hypothetical protein [Acinetobacter portensis]MDY6485433.1 hypothetical protein [Acinetobacter faecalis]MDY6487797.1 hypothetical protein [Acinetobacter faecalis]MDY6490295.1 hypothetical protein [Acinetobacter faecalis]